MMIRVAFTMFLTVIAFTTSSFSQYSELAPQAAGSFSIFSLPQNMGSSINTADMDQLPTPAANGLSLYFSSNRAGGQGGQDIYVSRRATLSSAWGAAQNLGTTLNTTSNDTISNLSPDGREMFMQSNRAGGNGGVDIYVSTRPDVNDDFGWATPVNIGPAINTTFNDLFGVLFVDPTTGSETLYFNSDRNTPGLNDIFQSSRNPDGTFNAPIPVVELNVPQASEERTAISPDGLEIYFSSNRLGPATIQAIYVTTRRKKTTRWKQPVVVENLNTAGSNAQPALSPDGVTLYLVSNRLGGFGLGDIYLSVGFGLGNCSDLKSNKTEN